MNYNDFMKNSRKNHMSVFLFLIGVMMWGQESPAVKVIARSLPNKVMLRWAVDQPLDWKKANEYGFLIERATISRNDVAVVPIEREQLVSVPLKPRPLEEWEALATKDQYAAVIAQSLFGDSFETTVPGSKMGGVFAVNDELEQRFTFALVAAEQNYEAAKLAGWGYEDTLVKKGEKYLYTISVAVPEEKKLEIEKGTVYASPDMYEELPKPIGLMGVFGDRHVNLSWNFGLLQSLYSNYIVERSKDNKTYEQLNGQPIFNAQQPKNSKDISIFYMDSIPNNEPYFYRVTGKTAFGERGPSSEPLTGRAEESLGFVPRIYQKEIPKENKVILFWEFKEEGNRLISKFQLRKADTNKGPFVTVKDNIPVTDRKTEYEGLGVSNYFTIVAIGKNGIESESYPSLVQPIDSVPPAPPTGATGVMDTTGVVKLSWTKNIEEDMRGYRIFKSNNPKLEFTEVTKESFKNETYIDTVPVADLNRKIYYKFQAEDQRYNRSKFSEILVVRKPDVIPPSPPVLTKYKVTEKGIQLYWIPSSSQDVMSHIVYRKKGTEEEKGWEKINESNIKKDTSFLDTKELLRDVYAYTIVAKDSTGLESNPSNPTTVVWDGTVLKEDDIRFSGIVDRELRFIKLSWKIKKEDVLEYRLYRSINGKALQLYKIFNKKNTGYTDVGLEINTEYVYGLQLIRNGGKTSIIKKINLTY